MIIGDQICWNAFDFLDVLDTGKIPISFPEIHRAILRTQVFFGRFAEKI
jgi:hypothetical protein